MKTKPHDNPCSNLGRSSTKTASRQRTVSAATPSTSIAQGIAAAEAIPAHAVSRNATGAFCLNPVWLFGLDSLYACFSRSEALRPQAASHSSSGRLRPCYELSLHSLFR